MNIRIKKQRATVAVLVLGVLGLLLVNFRENPSNNAGIFENTASAQIGISVPVQTATEYYVKFDGVDGEAVDRDHKDWINILSVSQGQYIPESSTGVGAGRGSSVFEEIVLKKGLDKASPKIAEAVCLGRVFPTVEIHLTRVLPGARRVTYYAYELKNVIVTSYHISGSTENIIPIDEFSLNFERIKATYTKFGADGQSEGSIEYGWDVVGNQPL